MRFTPHKTELPLQGIKLQEKNEKVKSYWRSLQKEPTVNRYLNSRLKAI